MSDLLRYRVTSQDGAPARFDESETGYWTPWYIAERRCNDLRARLEQAETRVAELEKAGRMLSFSEWKKHLEREDVQECGHVVYRSPAEKSLLYAKYRQSCEQNLDSLLLRKQAEAVERFGQEIGVFDAEYDDQEYVEIPRREVKGYAQRLRNLADEAERAGGQK